MNPVSEHYLVFNATDGIEAHPESMTWNQATGFVEAFPKRCKKQGYHKTGFGERIPPEWAILLVINNDNDVIARSYPTGPCRVALRHLAPWPLSMYFSCYPRDVHHGHYMAGLVIAEHDRDAPFIVELFIVGFFVPSPSVVIRPAPPVSRRGLPTPATLNGPRRATNPVGRIDFRLWA